MKKYSPRRRPRCRRGQASWAANLPAQPRHVTSSSSSSIALPWSWLPSCGLLASPPLSQPLATSPRSHLLWPSAVAVPTHLQRLHDPLPSPVAANIYKAAAAEKFDQAISFRLCLFFILFKTKKH